MPEPQTHEAMAQRISELESEQVRLLQALAKSDRATEQAINERDLAESALADAYEAATGQLPEWSNNFGFRDVVHEIQNRLDLQNDEFKRIRALTPNEEIVGLCDRAVSRITQHTPVIVQRDNAVMERNAMQAERDTLRQELEKLKRVG